LVEYAVSIQTQTNDTKNNPNCRTGNFIIWSIFGIPVPINERIKSAAATFPTMNEMSKLFKLFLCRSFNFKSSDFIDFVLNQYASKTEIKLYKLNTIIEKADNINTLFAIGCCKNAVLKVANPDTISLAFCNPIPRENIYNC